MFLWSPALHISTCVISALAALTNASVCLIVLFRKTMRTYTNGFVVSLALSDMLSGAIMFTYYVDVSSLSASLVNICYGVVLFCGVANVCLSSLDRYFAIVKPLRYRHCMPKYFPCLIGGSWIGAVIYACLPFAWEGNDNRLAMNIYRCVAIFFTLVLPYGVIIFVYRVIFLTVKKSAQLDCTGSQQRRIQARRAATALRVVKCFVIVSLVFLGRWSPMICMTILGVLDIPPPPFVVNVSPIALVLGSLVNPFVYSFIKPDFREALKNLFRTRRGRCRFYRPKHGNRKSVSADPTHAETGL